MAPTSQGSVAGSNRGCAPEPATEPYSVDSSAAAATAAAAVAAAAAGAATSAVTESSVPFQVEAISTHGVSVVRQLEVAHLQWVSIFVRASDWK